MSNNFIVVGDTTVSGGSVIAGSPFTDIDGLPVARLGDPVVCSQHGPTTIATGDTTLIIDGQPVARHMLDACTCGCKLMSTKQMHVFVDAGGAGGSATAAPKSAQHCKPLLLPQQLPLLRRQLRPRTALPTMKRFASSARLVRRWAVCGIRCILRAAKPWRTRRTRMAIPNASLLRGSTSSSGRLDSAGWTAVMLLFRWRVARA